MDYVVSVENSFYLRWQVDILCESMRLLGLEDRLLILACPSTGEDPGPIDHKRIFWHDNLGARFSYPPFNKIYGIIQAITAGELSCPFTVIDPDMFLVRPIPLMGAEITAQKIWYLDYDLLTQDGYCPKTLYGIGRDEWYTGGTVYQYRAVDPSLFNKMLVNLIHLEAKCAQRWERDMIATAAAISRSGRSLLLVDNFERSLDPFILGCNGESGVIHYCNGFRHLFAKRWYDKDKGFTVDGCWEPYDRILNLPEDSIEWPNSAGVKSFDAVKLMKVVIRSLLARKHEICLSRK